jgi:hypothetical protein
MSDQGLLVDRATQAWVRLTGTRLALEDNPWLDGPVGSPHLIGDEWLAREGARLGASAHEGGGLLDSFDGLAAPGFDPTRLRPEVSAFYEHTADWRLDVWSQWCPAAWPFGWLLSALFAQRLQQLALPMRPLDVAHGVDSRVVRMLDARRRQVGAAWIRTLRSTGQTIYSGWYGIARPPRADQSVRVVFPLPNGSLAVFLRPSVDDTGALSLTSPTGPFGSDGAYLLVADQDHRAVHARRIPINEHFRVYVDDEGTLRTDHALDLWTVPVLRLHYRLQRTSQL